MNGWLNERINELMNELTFIIIIPPEVVIYLSLWIGYFSMWCIWKSFFIDLKNCKYAVLLAGLDVLQYIYSNGFVFVWSCAHPSLLRPGAGWNMHQMKTNDAMLVNFCELPRCADSHSLSCFCESTQTCPWQFCQYDSVDLGADTSLEPQNRHWAGDGTEWSCVQAHRMMYQSSKSLRATSHSLSPVKETPVLLSPFLLLTASCRTTAVPPAWEDYLF